MFYWLKAKSYEVLGIADEAAHGTKRLQTDRLQSLEIVVPPKDVQNRIVSLLSAYDDLIENNTRRIKILEEMAQMLYREWFVNFRFPGHLNVKMVGSELGLIPKGWRVGRLSDLVSIQRQGMSTSRFPEELFAHFSIPAFDEGQRPAIQRGSEIKSTKYLVPDDCILLSKLNPRIPRLWLPKYHGPYRAIASTEFLILVPLQPGVQSFLRLHLSSSAFSSTLTGLSLGTSTSHQRVKPDDFLKLPTLIPAASLIHSFCKIADPIVEAMQLALNRNANLRTTRDLLLPKLVSGEIPVEAAEDTAAELIEQTA